MFLEHSIEVQILKPEQCLQLNYRCDTIYLYDMSDFLVRIIITIGVIWLTQFLLEMFPAHPQITRIILVAVTLLMLLFLVFGYTVIH
jgi:hypothetical protein